MLGVGIFIYPPVVAGLITNPWAFLGIWALGGLIALAGASAYAELGAAMPQAGGDYVFIRRAFGGSMAFACGWVSFAGGFCGSLATLAVAVAQFQVPVLTGVDTSAVAMTWPWGGEIRLSQLIAVGLILLFTELNVIGLRVSAWTQSITTVGPFVLLVALAGWTVATDFQVPTAAAPPTAVDTPPINAFVNAYLAVYFAYAGWNAIVYVAGEVRDPERNIPRALLGGTAAISLLYLLLCSAFLGAFTLPGLASAPEAGSMLANAIGGRTMEVAMVALIAAGIVSSINATAMGGGRFAYAMAQDGAFWSKAAHLNDRRGLPVRALRVQGALTMLLVMTGTFEQIYKLATVAMVAVGSLTVIALFVLRRTEPEMDRPYRAMGYPILPAIYLVGSAIVIGGMLWQSVSEGGDSTYALGGLAVLVMAFLGHRATSKR
jgi:basic amino acid/polyamine antiporter, APA family